MKGKKETSRVRGTGKNRTNRISLRTIPINHRANVSALVNLSVGMCVEFCRLITGVANQHESFEDPPSL